MPQGVRNQKGLDRRSACKGCNRLCSAPQVLCMLRAAKLAVRLQASIAANPKKNLRCSPYAHPYCPPLPCPHPPACCCRCQHSGGGGDRGMEVRGAKPLAAPPNPLAPGTARAITSATLERGAMAPFVCWTWRRHRWGFLLTASGKRLSKTPGLQRPHTHTWSL